MVSGGIANLTSIRGLGKLSAPDKASRTIGGSDRTCSFCHSQRSRYNCPRCNAPYCSLDCYRAKSHESCSQPFEARIFKEQLGSRSTTANDDERAQMMDILRRLEVNEQVSDDEESDDDNEGNVYSGVDPAELDGATTEELLEMLSTEDRKRFLDAVQNPERAAAMADKLFAGAEPEAGGDGSSPDADLDAEPGAAREPPERYRPWWVRKDRTEFSLDMQDESLEDRVCKLYSSMSSRPDPASMPSNDAVDLRFNVVAVLLSYAYILRHLDVSSLSTLRNKAHVKVRNHAEPVEISQTAPRSSSQSSLQEDASRPTDDVSDDDMPSLEEVEVGRDIEQIAAVHELSVSSHLPAAQREGEQEKAELRAVATELLNDLIPFVTHSPPRTSRHSRNGAAASAGDHGDHVSRTVLGNSHDAIMWVLSRLGAREASRGRTLDRITTLATQLLQDAKTILTPALIVIDAEQDSGAVTPLSTQLGESRTLLTAFADLCSFLGEYPTPSSARQAIRGKLAFYAFHILSLPASPSVRPSDGRPPHPRSLQALLGPGRRSIDEEIDRFAQEQGGEQRLEAWEATQRATASMESGTGEVRTHWGLDSPLSSRLLPGKVSRGGAGITMLN